MKPDFEHIKIFGTGTWKGKKVTLDMLKDAVQCQKDFENHALPDLKFDHAQDKDIRDKKFPCFENYPFSLGKLDNFSIEKDFIFTDYFHVLPEVKRLIEEKQITTHSAEVYYNVEFPDGKKYSMIITAVALLPAGTFPELITKFEPYMYQLDTNEFLKDCKYESKAVHTFNFSISKEEKNTMDLKKLYALAKARADKSGVACMSLDEFGASDEMAQLKYLEELEAKLAQSMGEGSTSDMSKEVYSLAIKRFEDEVKSLKTVISTLTDVNKLTQQSHSLVTEAEKLKDDKVKSLEDQVRALANHNKKSDVIKFVHSLSRVDNPKLPSEKAENLAIEILMGADDSEKINYSLGNKTIKSQEGLIKELLLSLSGSKSKTTKEVFEMDGIRVTDDKRADYEDGVSDEDIVNDQKVEAYSKQHNIPYHEAATKLGLY